MDPNNAAIISNIAVLQLRRRNFIWNNVFNNNGIINLELLYVVIQSEPEEGVRILNYVEDVVPNYSISTFKSHFRMTPVAFEAIVSLAAHCPQFRNRNEEMGGRIQLTPEKTVLIALWTLVTPESYRSVADRFDVVKSTVFWCIKKVVDTFLQHICKSVIKWHSVDDIGDVSNQFERYGLPNCVGAIDGCHIPIKAPNENPNDYINRKKFHSVVLQGICDANMFFIDCDVRWPGSVHDARVLRTSDFYNNFQDLFHNDDIYIIGDAAYPCLSWLIPPFKNNGHLTEQQVFFNTQLSKTRVVIERAFALLKGRFRRLKYLEMYSIYDINRTIIACCVLHNICLRFDNDVEDYITENIENRIPGDAANLADVVPMGLRKRQQLVTSVWNAFN